MNKEKLAKVFEDNQDSYPKLLKNSMANAVSEKWGMGILPPLSFLPYQIELGGNKRGKLLKKNSTPARNRFKYLFDKNNRLVLARSYLQKMDDGGWMYDDEIFTYNENEAFQFIFSGLADDSDEAFLEDVVFASIVNGRVQKSCGIQGNGEYNENEYEYVSDKLTTIKYRNWTTYYEEGELEISVDGDNLLIIDKSNGEVNQIFPQC